MNHVMWQQNGDKQPIRSKPTIYLTIYPIYPTHYLSPTILSVENLPKVSLMAVTALYGLVLSFRLTVRDTWIHTVSNVPVVQVAPVLCFDFFPLWSSHRDKWSQTRLWPLVHRRRQEQIFSLLTSPCKLLSFARTCHFTLQLFPCSLHLVRKMHIATWQI